jgi:hypothetical protein
LEGEVRPVVAKDMGVDDPTKVTAWLSLAADGKTTTPIPGFKVVSL